MFRSMPVLLLALLLSVFIISCGGSGDDDDDSSNPPADDDDNTDDDDSDDDDSAATKCTIGGADYEDGDVSPDNPCLTCNLAESATGWSFNDGATCDDGEYCNGEDTCASGQCSQHEGSPCADDGVFCNGEEVCDENTDSCDHAGDPCTDDGNFCNGTESCNEGNQACDHSGDPCTDDGQYCNGTESCSTTLNQCTHTDPPCGDDGDFCNGDESCNETNDSCDHTGDPCLAWETCDDTADTCKTAANQPEGVTVSGEVLANSASLYDIWEDYWWADLILWSETTDDVYYAFGDWDGNFAFRYVKPGTYNIELLLETGFEYDVMHRDSFAVEDLVVGTSDVVQDVDTTYYNVTGETTDSGDAAVLGTTVHVKALESAVKDRVTIEVEATYEIDEAESTYDIWLPDYDDYTFTWAPLPSTALAQEMSTGVDIDQDMTLDYQFGAAVNEVDVTLVDGADNIRNFWSWYMDMTFELDDGSMVHRGQVEDDYEIEMALADGNYTAKIDVVSQNGFYIHYYQTDLPAVVSGSNDVEIDVPLYEITGTVTDSGGSPADNVYVFVRMGTFPDEDAKGKVSQSAVYANDYTDADGEFAFYLPAGTYSFEYEPNQYQSDLTPEKETGVVVDADATHDYQFNVTPIVMDGTVTINGEYPETYFGTFIVLGEVVLVDEDGIAYFADMDTGGNYEMQIAPGKTYTVQIIMEALTGLLTYTSYYNKEVETGLSPSANLTRDFDFTLYEVTGYVYQPDGTTSAQGTAVNCSSGPVQLMIYKSDTLEYDAIETTSGLRAKYTIPAPEGTWQFGFSNIISGLGEYTGDVEITGDTNLDFVFFNYGL